MLRSSSEYILLRSLLLVLVVLVSLSLLSVSLLSTLLVCCTLMVLSLLLFFAAFAAQPVIVNPIKDRLSNQAAIFISLFFINLSAFLLLSSIFFFVFPSYYNCIFSTPGLAQVMLRLPFLILISSSISFSLFTFFSVIR